MTFIDLFAGIGGFRLGLERCGFKCVWSNEWDKYARQIYKKHFGECDRRDIRTVDAFKIPDHDLLCAGFPCQAFSIAGQHGGFDDTRGTLFFDIARIIKAKRPKYILLENVKGLLSHDNGRTFKTILATLGELGYDTETMVLDGYFFRAGRRQRVFIFATHRQSEADVCKGKVKALSLYACLCERVRAADTPDEEVGRTASRIIRTFIKLPDWVDTWDTFYKEEEIIG